MVLSHEVIILAGFELKGDGLFLSLQRRQHQTQKVQPTQYNMQHACMQQKDDTEGLARLLPSLGRDGRAATQCRTVAKRRKHISWERLGGPLNTAEIRRSAGEKA